MSRAEIPPRPQLSPGERLETLVGTAETPPPAIRATLTQTHHAPPPPPDGTQDGTLLPPGGFAPPLSVTGDETQVGRLDQFVNRTAAAAAPLAAGYRLVHRIGAGTFGTVWEAENEVTGERVAIKFFAVGDGQWGKLLEEVKLLQSVEGGQGIVWVKQVVPAAPGCPPYYVMTLARNGSLAKRLEDAKAARTGRGPVLPVPEVVRLFTRIARAMAFVHRKGILHCDLKPANVLLTDTDEPLIADFGQAHLVSDASPALGTFFYMAPDQATLDAAIPDTRWDVYALGAVLYEMLVGEPPRKDSGLLTHLRNTEHLGSRLKAYRDGIETAPPPAAHRKHADPLLVALIDRCLAPDPAKRPRDAGAIVALLDHRTWWRRTRPVLALGTVATALFVVLVTVLSLVASRAISRQAEENITREVKGTLGRTAWFGKDATENLFRQRIALLEGRAVTCPEEVRAALAAAAAKVSAAGGDPAALAEADRAAADRWLMDCLFNEIEPRLNRSGTATVYLPVHGRVFRLSRQRADDSHEPRAADVTGYAADWSGRAVFAGGVRPATAIGAVYRADAPGRPWAVEIATPVFAHPDGTGNVLAAVTYEVVMEDSLAPRITMPADRVGDEAPVTRAVQEVVADDRNEWVWHEAAMAADRDPADHPRCYAALAGRFAAAGGHPDAACGWLNNPDAGQSETYTDLVQWNHTGSARRAIAHYEPFYPYRMSRYFRHPAGDGREAGPRWTYVVQVDAAAAVAPVTDLRHKLTLAGSAAVVALAGLAAALWAGLLRVLRGREFAAHG